ncbi:MAG: hypothetical protein ABSE75_04255 [Acidimicrobiales bacterium]|jgi:hypothetical protein
MSPTEEDFELELRSLPGVLNVGISHRASGDVDAVKLVIHGQDCAAIKTIASQIASLYYPDATVSVEDASQASTHRIAETSRVALVRADFNADDGICEVQLSYDGRTGLGRAGSGQLFGGAEATLTALRDLGFEIPFYLLAAVSVATVRGWPVIVTLRSPSSDRDMLGIAQSERDLVSSSMATLDALNRFLATSQKKE